MAARRGRGKGARFVLERALLIGHLGKSGCGTRYYGTRDHESTAKEERGDAKAC